MSTYDAVRDLTLNIEGYRLEPLAREVARGFTLRRTVVVLYGGGEEGRGEEVDYDPRAQEAFQADEGKLPFPGGHTLDSFSLLQAGQTEYRRWAFESAALDLALRQAGLSLGEAVGREPQPLRFVVSTRTASVPGWLELYPDLHFKLDPDSDWTDEVVATLRNVDTVDFKGIYRGAFGSPPDAELYGRIAAAFPDAWIEDPALTPETTARARAAPRPDHLGCRDPRVERRRGASLQAEVPQLQAVALRIGEAALRLLRRLRSAKGSRSTAADSTSSAPAATRSNCSRRCSTPTHRTTSRRATTTRPRP